MSEICTLTEEKRVLEDKVKRLEEILGSLQKPVS